MLARHAENLFWTGRYVERAELTARMVDVTYHSMLESPPYEARSMWAELLDVLQLDRGYQEQYGEVTSAGVVRFLVEDLENPGSVLASISRARDNVRGARELISSEAWEATNSLYLQLRGRDVPAELAGQPYELFGVVKRGAQLICGVVNETMPHDEGWRFFTMGRMLERVEMTCRLLVVRVGGNEDVREALGFHDGLAILKSVSASEAFRKTHATMNPASVVEFLLLSSEFPRAVLYCLRSADTQLSLLGAGGDGRPGRARRKLGRLRSAVEFRNVDDLLDEGLDRFLERIQEDVRSVSDAIHDEYFAQAQPTSLHVVRAS